MTQLETLTDYDSRNDEFRTTVSTWSEDHDHVKLHDAQSFSMFSTWSNMAWHGSCVFACGSNPLAERAVSIYIVQNHCYPTPADPQQHVV